MSDWHRSFVRSGEKPKPVYTRSVQIPASLRIAEDESGEAARSSDEAIRVSILAGLATVESDLGNFNMTTGDGRRLSSDRWNEKRLRLKALKEQLLADLADVKARIKERNRLDHQREVATKADAPPVPSSDIARACALIMSMRAMLLDLEEPSPADNEVIRTAGAFLKDKGYLP